jgi:hypothetical protein
MFDSLPGTSQLVSAVFCVSFSGRVNVIESICEPVPRDWSRKDRQVFDMPKGNRVGGVLGEPVFSVDSYKTGTSIHLAPGRCFNDDKYLELV